LGLTSDWINGKISDMPVAEKAAVAVRKIQKKGLTLEKLTPFLVVISIVLAFLVGVLWEKVNYLSEGGSKEANQNTQVAGSDSAKPQNGKLSEDQAKKVPGVSDKDHFLGSKEAGLYLIAYTDLECPFCKQFHPTLQKINSEYKDRVAVVFRHFPLDQLHSKARKEAEAVECAYDLGGESAFWKMADKIFEVTPANDGLNHSLLPGMAKAIGLDQAAWKSCWDSGKYKDKVEEQYQGAITAGVSGTPTSFLVNKKGDTWMIVGAQPYDNIKAVIDEALKN